MARKKYNWPAFWYGAGGTTMLIISALLGSAMLGHSPSIPSESDLREKFAREAAGRQIASQIDGRVTNISGVHTITATVDFDKARAGVTELAKKERDNIVSEKRWERIKVWGGIILLTACGIFALAEANDRRTRTTPAPQ